MNWGLDMDKLLLIGVVALLIVGPERLPKAAATFSRFVRRAGEYLRETKTKMKDELGPDIDEVDWRKLDPRQYDPRRIIRDALFEEPAFDAGTAGSATVSSDPVVHRPAQHAPRTRETFTRQTPPPFDPEAT
ncbi:twin-arginine translocase TatA/TatE family subunit [Microbacterium soli]|uniref:Twin-arginine translocase TatA/TatE family subunit n=1 Tax=Microbacterium soli TaxID=446075 RepID=A0ABP7MR00_9MICO